jgi:carboxypeptidase D
MFGLFMENGPLRPSTDGRALTVNPLGWHRRTNLLYIDQPVGTGFSIIRDPVGYATDDGGYSAEFVSFLESFLGLYPELAGRDLYISGESYAGHYLPVIARAIIRQGSPTLRAMLKGVLIGNGWVDPVTQYSTYSDFAFGQGLVPVGVKRALDAKYATCAAKATDSCNMVLDDIVSLTRASQYFVNYYDVREYVVNVDDWPALTPPTRTYLRRSDVLEAIHVARYQPKPWSPCDDDVFVKLQGTEHESLLATVEEGLAAGIRFLFFAGQFDLICNHVGVGMLVRRLRWSGSADYLAAKTRSWIVNGVPAGYATATANNALTNIMMNGGSHMVLGDRPAAGLDMLERFIDGRRFEDYPFSMDPDTDAGSACLAECKIKDADGGPDDDDDDGDNDNDDDDDGGVDVLEGTLADERYDALETAAAKFRVGVTVAMVICTGLLVAITVLLVRRARAARDMGTRGGAILTSADDLDPAEGLELTAGVNQHR